MSNFCDKLQDTRNDEPGLLSAPGSSLTALASVGRNPPAWDMEKERPAGAISVCLQTTCGVTGFLSFITNSLLGVNCKTKPIKNISEKEKSLFTCTVEKSQQVLNLSGAKQTGSYRGGRHEVMRDIWQSSSRSVRHHRFTCSASSRALCSNSRDQRLINHHRRLVQA